MDKITDGSSDRDGVAGPKIMRPRTLFRKAGWPCPWLEPLAPRAFSFLGILREDSSTEGSVVSVG